MTKNRVHIPQKTRDQVLKEFRSKCAMCGMYDPQLHHIDEDPSNNDPINLIPLCPNCHLTDQHNPTQAIDPVKLRLFRQCKDPTILTPQFHPLFKRMRFLFEIQLDCDADQMIKQSDEATTQSWELVKFVEYLQMGEFYSNQIERLVRRPKRERASIPQADYGDPDALCMSRQSRKVTADHQVRRPNPRESEAGRYCEQLCEVRDKVVELVLELIRYQRWTKSE